MESLDRRPAGSHRWSQVRDSTVFRSPESTELRTRVPLQVSHLDSECHSEPRSSSLHPVRCPLLERKW